MPTLSRFLFALLLVAGTAPLRAIDYQNDILPLMKEHCWNCHSTEKEAKGGLALDDLKEMSSIHIADIGTIRPGDPEKSDFLARLKLGEGDDDFMPKRGSALRNSEIAKIEEWIRSGALIDAANPTEAELARSGAVKMKQAQSGGDVYLAWVNPEGRSIEAKFVGLEGEAVKIVGRNGRGYTVPFAKLSAESVAMAKKLGGR